MRSSVFQPQAAGASCPGRRTRLSRPGVEDILLQVWTEGLLQGTVVEHSGTPLRRVDNCPGGGVSLHAKLVCMSPGYCCSEATVVTRKWRPRPFPLVLTLSRLVLQVGSGAGSSMPGSSRQQPRQRITRVNLRDFIFCLEQDRSTARSLLLYKALLK